MIARLRLALARARLRFDDERGLCRLCQQGTFYTPKLTPLGVPQRYDVDAAVEYTSVVLHGRYHVSCALASIEARYQARFPAERSEATPND